MDTQGFVRNKDDAMPEEEVKKRAEALQNRLSQVDMAMAPGSKVVNFANSTRQRIKELASFVNQIKEEHAGQEVADGENRGEVMANLTLCYRHLEDASMRLGKVLQHSNGGVSIYDKNVVGSPEKSE